MHGYIFADIALGNFSTRVKLIVCDMSLPGILGQDFMMVNIKSWDLEALTLCTKDGKTYTVIQVNQQKAFVESALNKTWISLLGAACWFL